MNKTYRAIHQIEIYPVDGVIQQMALSTLSNDRGQDSIIEMYREQYGECAQWLVPFMERSKGNLMQSRLTFDPQLKTALLQIGIQTIYSKNDHASLL